MTSKSIIFDVNKCQNSVSIGGYESALSDKVCKKDEDIVKFTNDLVVQLWIINSKLDMRVNSEKSI